MLNSGEGSASSSYLPKFSKFKDGMMKSIVVAIVCASASVTMLGQSAPHSSLGPDPGLVRAGNGSGFRPVSGGGEPGQGPLAAASNHQHVSVVSDWTQHHVLFPATGNPAVLSRVQNDPRYGQSWYLHHRNLWWSGSPRGRLRTPAKIERDWNVFLGPVTYQPLYDFSFDIAGEIGSGTLNTMDVFGASYTGSGGAASGYYFATNGALTVTASGLPTSDVGTYPLLPGGPGVTPDPCSSSIGYDNLLLIPGSTPTPPISINGLVFGTNAANANVWDNNGTYTYSSCATGGAVTTISGGTFTLNTDPGGGQTYPAKFNFDLAGETPDCTNDYVAIGIPAIPSTGTSGQANIVGYNNLYAGSGGTCTTGPTLRFAYAVGSGEVPASIELSLDGTQLAFIENQFPNPAVSNPTSVYHDLTWTAGDGTTAGPIAPANDQKLTLSGASTTAPFIDYDPNANAAYVTTYSWATSTGTLYKISPAFGGSPQKVWSVSIPAIPSAPVFDTLSQNVFFTDSAGNIDAVHDDGTTIPTGITTTLASGAGASRSVNPVTVDSSNQVVYTTFSSNSAGTFSLVVQAPTSLSGVTSSVTIGQAPYMTYTGPYGIDFNNAYYEGTGTPVLFAVGKSTANGAILYAVPFTTATPFPGSITTPSTSTALTTGIGDASVPTEFFNSNSGADYLFVGVANNCVATTGGGSAGCVMSLNISATDTGGASALPAVNASTVAIPALGGSTGLIIDNDGTAGQESSVYYATKNGVTPGNTTTAGASHLVKATQSALQ